MAMFISSLLLLSIGFLASTVRSQSLACRIGSVCYALDQSGSVDDVEYASLQNFTISTARALAGVATTTPFYSAVAFSTTTKTIQDPTMSVEGEFVPAIEDSIDTRFDDSTNIFDGMRECREKLGDAVDGEARVLVMVTDGTNTVSGPTNPIEDYKTEGIAVITVGVGVGTNDVLLEAWASAPEYYVQTSFDEITNLTSRITGASCGAAEDVLPVISPTIEVLPGTPGPDEPEESEPPTPTASASYTPTPSPSDPWKVTQAPTTSLTPSPINTDVSGGGRTNTPTPSPIATDVLSAIREDCQAAYDACDFTLGNSTVVPEYPVGLPNDVAFSTRIEFKNKNKRAGIVNSGKFGVEFISDGGAAKPITDFGMHPFAPTAFYAVPIDDTMLGGSGIAHEGLQGNQLWMAQERCVRIFINAYEILYKNGYVAGNINLEAKDPKACVVFLTTT